MLLCRGRFQGKSCCAGPRHPAQPWLTPKAPPVLLQPPWYCVTLAGATMSGDQRCRPAESPAGLNGAENGKKKGGPVENLSRSPVSAAPFPSFAALLLPPHIFSFSEHSRAAAYFLCTERMFVSLHMLIKRKGQRGLKEKGLLLVWGEQLGRRRGSDRMNSDPIWWRNSGNIFRFWNKPFGLCHYQSSLRWSRKIKSGFHWICYYFKTGNIYGNMYSPLTY